MRRILTFAIAFSFTLLMCKGETLAEDNTVEIEYNAQTNEFSLEEHQDLFVNLKNVVPGDNLTQNINLKVVNLGNDETVKIYLQADNPNEDYNTLTSLDGVSLTVNSNGESIEEEIANPLLLEDFSENGEVNIEVNLTVDKTVGNEIANLDADIDWIFTAEITGETDMPKTGDTSNVVGVLVACIISLGVIVSIIIYCRLENLSHKIKGSVNRPSKNK